MSKENLRSKTEGRRQILSQDDYIKARKEIRDHYLSDAFRNNGILSSVFDAHEWITFTHLMKAVCRYEIDVLGYTYNPVTNVLRSPERKDIFDAV